VKLYFDQNFMKPILMKLARVAFVAALTLGASAGYAQEQNLTTGPTQAGFNVQVAQLMCPIQVQGLNIRDASGNLIASIPLLTDPASVGASTTIGDTLYAVIPPDANNQVSILVMYSNADVSTNDEITSAAQDVLNHNNWTDSTFAVSNISQSGQSLPAGTQFWICSSTGYLTLADPAGVICVAGITPPTLDPSDPALGVLTTTTGAATNTVTTTVDTLTTTLP
jgi:hypothetical protein